MKLTSTKALVILDSFKEYIENKSWIAHCICVGNAAEEIAKALKDKGYNIDVDKAKALGYVHDIGKYSSAPEIHEIKGYEFLKAKGFDDDYCNICLTHSFLNNDINCTAGGILDPNKNTFLANFIKNHEYTIEEKIINLCDLMCKNIIYTIRSEERRCRERV